MGFSITIPPPVTTGTRNLGELFASEPIALFPKGRVALAALVERYVRTTADNVAILTTTDSRYISSCVTDTIERYCRWQREIDQATRLVVVIHEWGLPRSGTPELAVECAERGLPLLEDCAYGLGSYFSDERFGRHGDYTLFSLPKFFGTREGGALISAKGRPLPASDYERSFLVDDPERIIERRRAVWRRYVELFECASYPRAEHGVPEVFLLPCADRFQELKPYLQGQGVEAGFWYGNEHLFLPCHQAIDEQDILHIRDLIEQKVGRVRLS